MTPDFKAVVSADGRSPKELLASPLLVDQLEGALLAAAYLVVRHGPEFAHVVDRLEKELEVAQREDPVMRARRMLDQYTSRKPWS